MDDNIHQRVLKLRDAALGSKKTVSVDSALASASYDCAVDSLLAVHAECSQSSSLSKDKNIIRFLNKHEAAVKALQKLRLTAADFEVKTVIGRGHFGEVQVVHEKSTGDVYAMKVMKKTHILQQADAAFFSEERDIMAWASSPWLTSLHYAFQDQQCLYLVMDFHPGGDLLTVMERQEGGMAEEDAKFYLTEIAMGLNDLHQLGFVHRDVKPENVLITRSGHIKLVDFGSAARLDAGGKVLESRLPVGTPEYIAPEVLTSLDRSADYGVCCDWWSLGIIAYELLFDATPFEGDSTAQTYGNIMNYKKSLSFSGDVEVSEALRELIKRLLTDKESRLQFRGLRTHPFFGSTNWDNLTAVIPPYIPSVASPDDTANFDVFEPKKEDRYLDIPSRDKSGFSGKHLPFVGFTFTRYDSAQLDVPDGGQAAPGSDELLAKVEVLQQQLEGARRELQGARDRKASLERECVIYQSQLEDYHRKLEIEKSERRQSDCKALQLLAEVRDQGRVAQELRENEATVANTELGSVVEQLEQDRLVASKRARRLQEDLKSTQQERDAALKKVSELKGKLGEVKQGSRRDVTALQTKLAKVTKNSLAKVAEMQDRLTEAHERYAEASKKLKAAEDARNKMEIDLKKSKLHVSMGDGEAKSVVKKLETMQLAKEKAEKTVLKLREQLKIKGGETSSLQTEGQQLRQQLKDLEGQLDEAGARSQQLEASERSLKKDLQEVRSELEVAREGCERLQASSKKTKEQLHSKTQLLLKHEEAIGKLSSSRQLLETKISELERLRKAAADSDSVDKSLKDVGQKVAELEGEKERLSRDVSSLRARLASQEEELRGTREELGREQESKKEAIAKCREQQRGLQSQLSEATNTAISQGERLREVRRAKRVLEQERDTLRSSLTKAESQVTAYQQRQKSTSEELQSLGGVRSRLAGLEGEVESLLATNSTMKNKVAAAQQEREELVARRREAERSLRDARKETEAQELNIALLQKNLSSLEEELAEARAAVQESHEREEVWQTARVTLRGDLEGTEARLDEAFATSEREKGARAVAEQRLSEALVSLEKTAAAHAEEEQSLQEQFVTQKQLALKYSDKVSELEKNTKLHQLRLKEVEHNLETERAVSSKLYDDLHSLGREHGKLKAAHMKLANEARQREDSLARTAADKDRVEQVHRSTAEAHQIQETRLQATIAQQSKLIDFLQNASSPPSKSRLRIGKAFKLTRKSRDPAKEIAEWNKIKGLASKPTKGSGAVALSSTPSVSLQRVIRSSSDLLTPSTTTPLATPIPTHQQSAAQPQLLVAGPSSLKATKRKFPQVTQYFSTAMPPDDDDLASSLLGLKDCSVSVQREPITTSSPKRPATGTKRSNSGKAAVDESSGGGAEGGANRAQRTAKAATQLPILGEMTIEHNIPHKFSLKSAPLRKSYSCVSCKIAIKAMHKLAKCCYCGIVCHPRCIDSLPNNCGLPPLLAEHVISQLPATKRPRREAGPGGGQRSPNDGGTASGEHVDCPDGSRDGEGRGGAAEKKREGPPEGREEAAKKRKVLKAGTPKASGVSSSSSGQSGSRSDREEKSRTESSPLRVEKVHVVKGEIKSEGWLVLTNNALCFYDRDPNRATRKPLQSFFFDSPDCAFVFLPVIEKRFLPYASPSRTLPLAFGLKQHSVNGEEQAVFVTSCLQSKMEWVEAVQKVISQCSQQPPQTPQVVATKLRELKSVSLVHVRTPQQLGASLNKSDDDSENLELSITSDMLESPSSLV